MISSKMVNRIAAKISGNLFLGWVFICLLVIPMVRCCNDRWEDELEMWRTIFCRACGEWFDGDCKLGPHKGFVPSVINCLYKIDGYNHLIICG